MGNFQAFPQMQPTSYLPLPIDNFNREEFEAAGDDNAKKQFLGEIFYGIVEKKYPE